MGRCLPDTGCANSGRCVGPPYGNSLVMVSDEYSALRGHRHSHGNGAMSRCLRRRWIAGVDARLSDAAAIRVTDRFGLRTTYPCSAAIPARVRYDLVAEFEWTLVFGE